MSKVIERYTVPGPDGTVLHMRYVTRVEWRNIGFFFAWGIVKECGFRTPWGNLIFGGWLPFEYRYGGKKPLLSFGRTHLRWVRLRTMEEDLTPETNRPSSGPMTLRVHRNPPRPTLGRRCF